MNYLASNLAQCSTSHECSKDGPVLSQKWVNPMNQHLSEMSCTRLQETSVNLWELMLGQVDCQVVNLIPNSPFVQSSLSLQHFNWFDCLILNLCMPLILRICTYLDQCDCWLFVHNYPLLNAFDLFLCHTKACFIHGYSILEICLTAEFCFNTNQTQQANHKYIHWCLHRGLQSWKPYCSTITNRNVQNNCLC